MPKLSAQALSERRLHILAAAARCFERQGFHRTTIADVRREAGVSTGAVYTYFENKAAIIRGMLEEAQVTRRAELRRARQRSSDQSPAPVLLQSLRNVFTAHGRHVARVNMNLWAEAVRNPAVAALARTAIQEATEVVAEVVEPQLRVAGPSAKGNADALAAVLVSLQLGIEVQTAVGVRLSANTLAETLQQWLPVPARKVTARNTRARRMR